MVAAFWKQYQEKFYEISWDLCKDQQIDTLPQELKKRIDKEETKYLEFLAASSFSLLLTG